ncbi:serine hydrolase domain-containing protein [Polaribacter porphyrae]|uniref:Beta-lactamase-related domain-containing protein n=1 Tax=Polaribacter porphyrae TaxID=1137780 RepID=A0A2S7WJE3_9FLAO|nr:serine hydrolase domain-containing protein [Polaribacter porphyrae]PQJ77728.1 hypothetical protein BTO18_00360 [Polaribacter porphyrae]
MKTKLITLSVLFFAVAFSNCQNNAIIDSYLKEKYNKDKLNGNVLVIKNGQTIYENSFGFADGSKTIRLTKDFRFDLGSIYKEFPAVSILQLQEKGLLNVNDKIDVYLKDLPNWAHKVSIKNMLQYTSGLPRVEWGKYFKNGDIITDEKIKSDVLNLKELNFEPGSDYLYTNHSPMLLAQIVEKITKQPFVAYVKQNLFIPFGLKSAVIHSEIPYSNRTLMAIPFDKNYKEDAYKLKISGVLFSLSARDLYNWLEQLHTYKIISKTSLKLLSEKANFSGNIQSPLGNVEFEDNKIIEHSHHGTSGNYECIVRRFFNGENAFTIIIQTNQKHKNVHEISNEIKTILKE